MSCLFVSTLKRFDWNETDFIFYSSSVMWKHQRSLRHITAATITLLFTYLINEQLLWLHVGVCLAGNVCLKKKKTRLECLLFFFRIFLLWHWTSPKQVENYNKKKLTKQLQPQPRNKKMEVPWRRQFLCRRRRRWCRQTTRMFQLIKANQSPGPITELHVLIWTSTSATQPEVGTLTSSYQRRN